MQRRGVIESIAAGDSAAFEMLVARHRRELLRHAGRIVGRAEAEDVVQLTFLRAYEAISSGAAPVDVRPWLFRIAHNAALDVRRRRRAGDPDHAVTPPSAEASAADEAETRERLRQVVEAVGGLPERERRVLVGHVLDGASHETLARREGLSSAAVRQLAARARRRLRLALSGHVAAPVVARLARALPFASAARGAAEVMAPTCSVVVAAACLGAGTVAPEFAARAPSLGVRPPGAAVAGPSHAGAVRAPSPDAAARPAAPAAPKRRSAPAAVIRGSAGAPRPTATAPPPRVPVEPRPASGSAPPADPVSAEAPPGSPAPAEAATPAPTPEPVPVLVAGSSGPGPTSGDDRSGGGPGPSETSGSSDGASSGPGPGSDSGDGWDGGHSGPG